MLNPYKLHTWFSNEFILQKTTQGWYAFACPMCNELINRKKMAVHYKYEIVKCWICGYKERAIDFIQEYAQCDYPTAKEKINNCVASSIDLEAIQVLENTSISDVNLPDGFQTILEGEGMMGRRARSYLEGRGFDLEELDKKGIGYVNKQSMIPEEDYFGYLIIPFKTAGKLVYFIGRDFTENNFLRYKNPPKTKFGVGKGDLLFNEDALRLYDEVYISEGWADACEMGRTGLSTQGWSLSPKQRSKMLSSDTKRFVFIPDVGFDKAVDGRSFYSKAVEAAIDFIDHKEEVHVLDLSVFGELGKDANEIGKKNILELRKKSQPLTLESAADILMS